MHILTSKKQMMFTAIKVVYKLDADSHFSRVQVKQEFKYGVSWS